MKRVSCHRRVCFNCYALWRGPLMDYRAGSIGVNDGVGYG